MATQAPKSSKSFQRRQAAREAAARLEAQRRRQLLLRGGLGAGALIAVLIVALLAVRLWPSNGPSSSGASSDAGVVAGLENAAQGQTVDGIPCGAHETLTYHVHAHLAVFDNGSAKVVPAGIGIPGAQFQTQSDGTQFAASGICFYWLHAHTADGVIHIEAPQPQAFTLGQYFDIWGTTLSSTQVGSLQGKVTAFVDSSSNAQQTGICNPGEEQPYTGDPRSIQLGPHVCIQLDVGSSTEFQRFQFPSGL